jgi:hypothetical protein
MKMILILWALFWVSGVLAECGEGQIDINSASLSELEKIIWIGPATAQKIADARPFKNVDELDRVNGIGEVKLADIKSEGIACVDDEVSVEVEEDEIETEEETYFVEIEIEETQEKQDEEKEETEDDDEEKSEKFDLVEEKEIIVNKISEKSTISLNSIEPKEIIYESKNAKVVRYAPYAFSFLLIFLLFMALKDK